MAELSDPYKAIEDMYKAMSDEELWRAISILALYQQDIMIKFIQGKNKGVDSLSALIHSQQSIQTIFTIMYDRSKKNE